MVEDAVQGIERVSAGPSSRPMRGSLRILLGRCIGKELCKVQHQDLMTAAHAVSHNASCTGLPSSLISAT